MVPVQCKQKVSDSDCVLEPIKMYKNPIDPMGMSYIVLCEVMNPDGTPHESNTRAKLREIIEKLWWTRRCFQGYDVRY
jgi:glutamine synthetase